MTQGIDERELLRRIAELPREMRPERDPWPEIAARIEPAARRNRWPMLAAAASLVAALVAVWMLAPQWSMDSGAAPGLSQAEPPGPEAATVSSPAPDAPYALPIAVAASEAEYQAAFREFIPVGAARSELAPGTVAKIETGWADLRATEKNLVAALEMNPDDPFLNDRMLELRARQLGFLQKLATLDMDNRRLTI